jgi:hypothetical protein
MARLIPRRGRRGRATLIAALLVGAGLLLTLGSLAWDAAGEPSAPTVALPATTATGVPIRPGFLGLSFEFEAVRAYTGSDAAAINPVLVQLIRNLTPGQRPSLRIGGDSTDRTWWPVHGTPTPAGVKYRLTRGWLATTRALARTLGARLILGVNLAIDRPALAAAEARALLSGLGRSSVAALEIGNEPDVYNRYPEHLNRLGALVPARPHSYDVPAFTREFSRMRRALPRVPVAGPAFGNVGWMSELPRFLAAEPGLRMVTFHRYPLNCFAHPGSPKYATIGNLLSDTASAGLAETVTPFVADAHAKGLPLRVDEINSVACAGARGVSNTFASALWTLDTLFAMARAGVDGVNFHTLPGSRYEPFGFTHRGGSWRATVYPEYFGMLMFAQAAPVGSELLPIASTAGPGVRLWATRAPNRTIHVVLINTGASAARVGFAHPSGAAGSATSEELRAPSLTATGAVTIGGQSFGSSTETGRLAGARALTTIKAASGTFTVTTAPDSATLLTIPAKTNL